jgi:hypothetical protein
LRRDKKKLAKLAGPAQNPHKQARTAGEAPEATKLPRSLGIDDEDAYNRRPVWRFADLDMEAPPGAASLQVSDFRELHSKLGEFETQTCSEIWGQHDNGCKRYEVENAHDNITSRLTSLEKDDETAVHTLRLTGAFRVYGILRQNIFHLLWIDRDHEMFPSQKKNT